MSDERINSLEEKIMFLERTVGELNDVIIAMRNEIDGLKKETKRNADTISEIGAQLDDPPTAEEERPPHW